MRGYAGESLTRAADSAARLRAAPAPPPGAGAAAGILGLGGGAAGPGASRQPNIAHHQEQYRHFTGWVHSTVSTVAKRIARQRVRLARVPLPQKAANPSAPAAFSVKGFRPRAAEPWAKAPRTARELQRLLWFKARLPGAMKDYHETAELVEAHPLLAALDNPNPYMTRWALFYVTVCSLLLTGKGYWWIKAAEPEAGAGGPAAAPDPASAVIEIYYLPAHWVSAAHTEKALYAHWDVRPEGARETVRVPAEQIVYFALPDPSNPLGAIAPLQAQARAVLSDENIAEAQRRGFANGIFPGMAIIVGRQPDAQGVPGAGERPVLNREQRAQLIAAVKQTYRGVEKMDEPLILDQLIQDVKRITQTNREMDFMASGQYTKERITQGFGVNPISMGQVEGANRATSATADDHLCQNTVNPIIELVSECLTAWMGGLFAAPGEKLLVYLEEAAAVDPDSDRASWALLMQWGAAENNELRAGLLNLPPLDGGDVSWVPQGYVPVDAVSDPGTTRPPGFFRGRRAAGVIDLPDRRQAESYDCGAAAAWSVAEHFGLCPGWAGADFAAALKTGREDGTHAESLAAFFKHHGCTAESRDGMTLEALRAHCAAGRPVLCPVQAHGTPREGEALAAGHWVVVKGVTADGVELQDPAAGPGSIPGAAFLAAWDDRGPDGRAYWRFGIAVGYSLPADPPAPDPGPEPGKGLRPRPKAAVRPREERAARVLAAQNSGAAPLAEALRGYFRAERERVFAGLATVLAACADGLRKAAPPADDGDEDRAAEAADPALAPLLARLLPVAPMTARLREAVEGPLKALALDAAGEEAEEMTPREAGALARWVKAGRPEEDRGPLPKAVRRRVLDALAGLVSDPYWEGVTETTRRRMARAVRRGVSRGESVEEIEARLRRVVSPAADDARAEMIARTEATAGYNLGQQAAREQLAEEGFVAGKEWSAVVVGSRPSHQKADGQVRKVTEKFRVGGEAAEYPGDPDLPAEERVHCRCVSLSVPA